MGARNYISHYLLGAFVSDYTGAAPKNSHNLIRLNRVQDSSFSISPQRQSIKQLSTEHYLEEKIVYAPEVNFNFSYLLTDGHNEKALGLNIYASGDPQPSALEAPLGPQGKPFLNKVEEDKNIFLAICPQGGKGVSINEVNNQVTTGDFVGNDIIGFGNCYLTNMSIEGQVGDMARASVAFAAANVNYNCYGRRGDGLNPEPDPAMSKYSGVPNPSINTDKGTYPGYSGFNFVQDSYEPYDSALLPGDIYLTLENLNYGGHILKEDESTCNEGPLAIQGFKINLPIQRKDLYGFGSMYPYSRKMMWPQEGTLDISLHADIYKTGSLSKLLCEDRFYDLMIYLKRRECPLPCEPGGADAITYRISNAKFRGESFSHSMGDFGEAQISFSFENTQHTGLYMSGTYPINQTVLAQENLADFLTQNQEAFLFSQRPTLF